MTNKDMAIRSGKPYTYNIARIKHQGPAWGNMENKIIDLNNEKKRRTDHIIRATAANGQILAFAASTKNLVQQAHDRHGTSPVATAALGRLLTAGAMMGIQLKGERDLLTLTIRGDGPLQGIVVTADPEGNVKGFVYHPEVWLPPKSRGKLDVGGAVGRGTLTVVRDQPAGEPYSSQVQLVTGEIGDDLTAYFAMSEQVPSSVGLGVLVDTDQNVRQAGGFLIQLMPGCSAETTDRLEEKLKNVSSVTTMLENGLTPEGILKEILGDMEPEILQEIPARFYCGCSRERVSRALVSLGTKELKKMIAEGRPVDLQCHFCGRAYSFTPEELQEIFTAAQMDRLRRMQFSDPE